MEQLITRRWKLDRDLTVQETEMLIIYAKAAGVQINEYLISRERNSEYRMVFGNYTLMNLWAGYTTSGDTLTEISSYPVVTYNEAILFFKTLSDDKE